MLPKLAKSWLELQCQMIPSIHRGIVVVGTRDLDRLVPTACWPEATGATPELTAAAQLVLTKGSAIVRAADGEPVVGVEQTHELACPLLVDGELFGVVAVEVSGGGDQQRAVMQLLQWGASWLEFLVRREASAVTTRLLTVVEVIAAGLEHEGFEGAATATATEIARALSCSRVAIGFVKGRRARVHALSHSARFEDRSSLLRDIEATMDEALDQNASMVYPARAEDPPRVTTAHERLAGSPGSGSVCTAPFGGADGLIGAITIERQGENRFDGPSVELCEAVAALIGPILQAKRMEDRLLPVKVLDGMAAAVGRLLGPRRLRLKLATLAVTALIAVLVVASGEYRVSAPATLESTTQRVVVAPRDGYLARAEVRAGDAVREGELMATLESKELELERLKWSSQREQLVKEHREALAKRDRARIRILKAQLAQADANLDLVDARLERTRMLAPFDGVVVAGDLSQVLGSAVERGETLFEVAPLDGQRVIAEVDETDIARIRVGQRGRLTLAALSNERLPFTVERITPTSTAENGRNYFRVEAALDEPDDSLRPGMQGVAKIGIDRRKLAWIWTHQLVDWLRLKLWSWWP